MRRSPPARHRTSTPRRRGSPRAAPGSSTRRAAESEPTECTSSQSRFTTLTLFDCRWPMKCQRKRVAVERVLLARGLARGSRRPPRCPPPRARPSPPGTTYFVATTTVTPAPTSSRTPGVALGDLAGPTRRSCGHARRQELTRSRELGLAPVELAVELAPADLGEDLADARRLRQPERDQVGAADLEPDVAEPRRSTRGARVDPRARARAAARRVRSDPRARRPRPARARSARSRSAIRGATSTAPTMRSTSRRRTFSRSSQS